VMRRRTAAFGVVGLTIVLLAGVVAVTALLPATPQVAAVVPSPSPSAAPSPTPRPTPRPTAAPTPTPLPTPSPTPATEAESALTGELVPIALANRLPIAVSIDDNRVARPQSGFNGAAIVYQAPADGGETRYVFVYGPADSSDIGPVRSGRIYLAEWASEVRAAFGHYGGDRKTRRWLTANHGRVIWSIDGIVLGRPTYHRIASRRAPHNAYTSTAALRKTAIARGADDAFADDAYRRRFVDEAPLDARGTGRSIRVPYRTGIVTYAYDRASNLYLRAIDGKAQVDPADGKRVTTRNVVVLFMAFRIDTKIEPGHARPVVESIGTGKAWVYREGRVVLGTWRKDSATSPTILYDADGRELPLVRGRTFYQVVPLGTKVSHAG
jgi:hypothetical protein